MPWLSDPSQATTTASWLNSPAVIFIGLMGSVISIIQAVVAVGKWTKEMAGKEGARRRLSITFATACLAANAVLAPVTWTTVIAVDRSMGDPRADNLLYPIMTCSMVLAGSFWVLFVDVPRRKWPSIMPSFLIAIGLIMPALTYNFTRASIWERGLVDILPGIAFAAFILALLTRALSKKPERRDSPAPAAS
jgi:hypothetical protein